VGRVRPGVGTERPEGQAADVGERALRPVEEARQTELGTGPRGETASSVEDVGSKDVGRVDRVGQGDERHHVDGTQSWMDAGVRAEINERHGGGHHLAGRLLDYLQGTSECEHRTVMLGVRVDIEYGVTAGGAYRGDDRVIPPLTPRWTTSAAAVHASDGDGVTHPAATEHPAALTFRLAAPHTVIDSFLECVLQTGLGHRALGADALGSLYPDSVARKENRGRHVLALSHAHPFRIHCPSIDL
jgi:hypothetical protein